MAIWKPSDGYFGTLLTALLGGGATRREQGKQNSGGGGGVGAGRAISADVALRVTAVWACIRLAAEAAGAMPIRMYENLPDGTRKEVTDHWLVKLLRKPNRYQTRNEFIETVIINLLVAGNSYVGKKFKNEGAAKGEITSLLSMSASQTEVTLVSNGDKVFTTTTGKDAVVLRPDAVWHAMLMPSNSIVGLSPIQYGARSIGIADAADSRVSVLAANGFKPTGVLMFDKFLKADQREQIRKQFDDLQTGEGDPLKVLEAGMKYQQISLSPKDAQLIETRRFSVEDIGRLFGTPSVMINDTSASTVWGTGIGEIKQGYYTLTLQPMLLRLAASMERWLLEPGDRVKYSLEFDFAQFLRGDAKTQVETLTKAISGKLMTIDEARAVRGDPPLAGGKGAVMYDQSQMIPLGGEGATNDDPTDTED